MQHAPVHRVVVDDRVPGRSVRFAAGGSGRASVTPSRTVKWNVLPSCGALSSQMRPPISSTSVDEIVSPSPVPPKRRVVDPSACLNGSKIAFCLSAGMPMPLSLTK